MVSFSLFAFTISSALAVASEPLHVPIVRRGSIPSVESYAKAADDVRYKYGFKSGSSRKRASSAAVPLTDEVCAPSSHLQAAHSLSFEQENDSSYSGVISIGTP